MNINNDAFTWIIWYDTNNIFPSLVIKTDICNMYVYRINDDVA